MPRNGSLTLSEVQGLTLVIRCAPRDRRGQFNVSRLIAQHGPDAKLTDLLAVLVGTCPKAHSVSVHERCGAVYDKLNV
jgi:hypothetical protein